MSNVHTRIAMYNNLFFTFVKYWRRSLSSGDHVLWTVMSKKDEEVCLLHIVAAAAAMTTGWEMEKEKSVLPTGISAVELTDDYMGSGLMNWGWNGTSSELRQRRWSLLLCYVCDITVLLLMLVRAGRTGERPGILQQRAACGGLFFPVHK